MLDTTRKFMSPLQRTGTDLVSVKTPFSPFVSAGGHTGFFFSLIVVYMPGHVCLSFIENILVEKSDGLGMRKEIRLPLCLFCFTRSHAHSATTG